MSNPQPPVAPAGAAARVRTAVHEFTAGVRQFWQGYWANPPGC